MADFNDGLVGSFEAVKKIGVSLGRLRYWERMGIVNPKFVKCGIRRYRRYSQGDIEGAMLIKVLVDGEKYSLEGAIRKLKEKTICLRGK